MNLKFYDYSEAGSIYIGGALRYAGSMFKIAGGWVAGDLQVTGQIEVAGPYTGHFQFNNLLLYSDDRGNLISIFAPMKILLGIVRVGSVKVTSGDYTYFRNPYPITRD